MISYTLSELASFLGAELVGDGNAKVTGLATLQAAREGDLSFLANPRYAKFLADSKATVVILSPSQKGAAVNNALILDNPYHGYAKVTHLFDPNSQSVQGVAGSASVAKNAKLGELVFVGEHVVIEEGAIIGDGVYIGAGSYIGKGACIGAGTRLHPNVNIYHQVTLGDRCIIHSGVVIGADGFGFAPHSAGWEKIAQLGGVVLGNDVEVGANTCIDRGALDDTVVGNGVKLDNQIQIAHNVIIGDNSVIAAATVIVYLVVLVPLQDILLLLMAYN